MFRYKFNDGVKQNEIKQVDYTQNSQQLLKKLDDYTKVKVPDLTGYETQKIQFFY